MTDRNYAASTGLLAYIQEVARDAIGAALVAGTGVTISVNDAADTITIVNSRPAPTNTDGLTEGATNLYYTSARFNSAFAGKNTDGLAEGATNLYYTQTRFNSAFAGKNTDGLAEGATNLYYLDERVDDRVAALLQAGQNVTLTYDDAANTLTIKAGVKNNYVATSDPTVNDDSGAGYSVGSVWFNTATGWLFRARSVAVGAARWTPFDIQEHPGYVAGRWYPPSGNLQTGAGVAIAANSMRAFYGILKERCTLSDLAGRVTTVSAGGNFQLAIYGPSAAINKPGALLGNTASLSTGSATTVTGALAGGNLQLEPGGYWFVSNCDNGTAVLQSISVSSIGMAQMHGSTSVNPGLSNTSGLTGFSSPQTFGTWPSDLSSNTWSDILTASTPAVEFKIASVP